MQHLANTQPPIGENMKNILLKTGTVLLTVGLLFGCEATAIDETLSSAENASASESSAEKDEALAIYNKGLAEGLIMEQFGGAEISEKDGLVTFTFKKSQSVWMKQGNDSDSEFIDASDKTSLKFTYVSDVEMNIRLIWGDDKPGGYASDGKPWWTAEYGSEDKTSGFIEIDKLPVAEKPTEYSIDFDKMYDPAYEWAISCDAGVAVGCPDENYEGDRIADMDRIYQIVFVGVNGTGIFGEFRFE